MELFRVGKQRADGPTRHPSATDKTCAEAPSQPHSKAQGSIGARRWQKPANHRAVAERATR
jgi:hypothetical protein